MTPYRSTAIVALSLLLTTSSAGADDAEPPRASQGARLVYEVHVPKGENATELVARTAEAIDRRLNPSLFRQLVPAAKVRPIGENRIEIVTRSTAEDRVARAKTMATRPGTLEFAILANDVDHGPLIERAADAERDVTNDAGRIEATWTPVATNADDEPAFDVDLGSVAVRTRKVGDEERLEVLVVRESKRNRVTGEYLTRARAERDQAGRPSIALAFSKDGGERLQRLTAANQPGNDGFRRRMAVVVDGEVLMAPNLHATISARAQITGVEPDDVVTTVEILNAGSLPARVGPEPVVEEIVALPEPGSKEQPVTPSRTRPPPAVSPRGRAP